MDDLTGIELALLEGIDEELLARLHRAGVRTREELARRLATLEGRRMLAHDLDVSLQRVDAIHYLNFLLPEERAERVLELERRVEDRHDHLVTELRQVWRTVIGLGLGLVAILVLALVFLRGGGTGSAVDEGRLSAEIDTLRGQVDALKPAALQATENRFLSGLAGLGPAPGWNGPLDWTLSDSHGLSVLLGRSPAAQAEHGASLALARLAEIENAPPDSLGPADRARRAAALVSQFRPYRRLDTMWDAAGILIRERLRSRALGLAPADSVSPPPAAAAPWSWTSPGFLTAEELTARLEALPLREDNLPRWFESLGEIRKFADQSRQSMDDRPEALARDYWIRRAELELAVAAAVLGREDLSPYRDMSPRDFLVQRRTFLANVAVHAPAAARAPLDWLWVEYDEGERLMDWLDQNRARVGAAEGKRWAEAMEVVEAERARDGMAPDAGLAASVRRALGASGSGGTGDPWTAPRTRWEAGLRPLLMVTRASGTR
jgi:hypothetical protein